MDVIELFVYISNYYTKYNIYYFVSECTITGNVVYQRHTFPDTILHHCRSLFHHTVSDWIVVHAVQESQTRKAYKSQYFDSYNLRTDLSLPPGVTACGNAYASGERDAYHNVGHTSLLCGNLLEGQAEKVREFHVYVFNQT